MCSVSLHSGGISFTNLVVAALSEKLSSLNLNARFLKPNEINEKPHGKRALAIRGGFGCVSGVARAGEVRPAAVHTTQPQPQPSEARDVRLDTPVSTMAAAAVVAARSLSFRHLHPLREIGCWSERNPSNNFLYPNCNGNPKRRQHSNRNPRPGNLQQQWCIGGEGR